MFNPLPAIIAPSAPAATVRPDLRPGSGESRPWPGAAASAPGPASGREPWGNSLERLVEAAARELFPGREVAVESFYDKASGRYVHRIADSESGELLLQTPPDELLRFFASGREPYGRPLLDIDA